MPTVLHLSLVICFVPHVLHMSLFLAWTVAGIVFLDVRPTTALRNNSQHFVEQATMVLLFPARKLRIQ